MDTRSVAAGDGILYAAYQQAIRDEEARLGRQLTPLEVERINYRVYGPHNRAIWAGWEDWTEGEED